MENFTPLNTTLGQVFMSIWNERALMLPDKLKGDLNKRPRNKYWCFHRNHGHDTSDCYNLKQQIEALIKQAKLQWFVEKERDRENPPKGLEPNRQTEEKPRVSLRKIHVIVEGITMAGSSKKARKTYLWMMQSMQITSHLPKLARVYGPTINFTEDDAWRLHHPHDDALDISLLIANFNTWWVLVDNGNSVDILY